MNSNGTMKLSDEPKGLIRVTKKKASGAVVLGMEQVATVIAKEAAKRKEDSRDLNVDKAIDATVQRVIFCVIKRLEYIIEIKRPDIRKQIEAAWDTEVHPLLTDLADKYGLNAKIEHIIQKERQVAKEAQHDG